MANNIFGIILAGGQGTRMGNAERQKNLPFILPLIK